MKALPVVTLGPSGTCSDFVLRKNMGRFAKSKDIQLVASYELAIQAVEQNQAHAALVAAAYPNFHNLVFNTPTLTHISDCFIAHTPPLIVAATKPFQSASGPIACFSAMVPLARRIYPTADLISVSSNSEAARVLLAGETDLAITNDFAAKLYGLLELHSFGSVPMAWAVFTKIV